MTKPRTRNKTETRNKHPGKKTSHQKQDPRPKTVKQDPGHRTEDPISSMCQNCRVCCCRLTVDLTTYDIARIAIIEKKPPVHFVTYCKAAEDDRCAFRALGTWIKLEMRQSRGRCVFYDPKKQLGCFIENSKPALCLIYPFHLGSDGPVLRKNPLCPPERLMLVDKKKMSAEVLKDANWEHERYFEFVDDWNSSAMGNETPDDFVSFAVREMILEKMPLGSVFRKIRRKIKQRFAKR